MADPRLQVRAAPFVHQPSTTPSIMRDVTLSLLPVVAMAIWTFGATALLVLGASLAGALATEAAFRGPGQLRDWSAGLTGLLLGLTLPPAVPLWMAFLGGVAGVGLGKVVWGGLGQNLFNPALVGRAFLQAAFPVPMTTWIAPRQPAEWLGGGGASFAPPLLHGELDAVTAATPLGLAKFEGQVSELLPLLVGDTAGSLGETSAALILLGGIYLAARRALDWRIPVGVLASTAALSGLAHLLDPGLPPPQFMLLSGGLMLGAVYMATDPVTSPTTPAGRWIFAAGVGALVVLIRLWGGLPEGVMYAVLLMNAAAPLIERYTQPRIFGRGRA